MTVQTTQVTPVVDVSGQSLGRKVHLISLGCARNRVDSEVMLGSMIQQGWSITTEPTDADAIVVNTCGFINSAKEESIDTILSMAALKRDNPDLKLVVTGCLTQRYKSQLATGMPEVDLFLGTDEFPRIATLLDSPPPMGTVLAKRTHYLYSGELPKLNTLARHAAYVKVAEGCQHNCAFCIIPAIRGKLRSRPVASVVKEVEKLVAEGVQEINLIAQDLAAYGRDLKETDLLTMLKALVAIDGLRWLRLLYVYPENISDEFLEFFATEPKIVKYLDIPVQHADDDVLKRMNRGVTREQLASTFAKVRARVPDLAIRTSVMVGFPGETEEQFLKLLDFVREQKFTHLGCFSYSREEGTVAGRMTDQIEEDVKAERLDRVMRVQRDVSATNLKKWVGQLVPVLVEGRSEETSYLWRGRMPYQAPEVDGIVYINEGDTVAGQIQMVEITDSFEYDLVGRVVGPLH